MIKNFWEARSELANSLSALRSELEYHQNSLAAFKSAYEKLDDSTPTEVGNILHAQITRETARVNSLKSQIAAAKKELNEKYSLAPAIR